MFTSDRKMLELCEYLKSTGEIKFDTEFCDAIGMRKQNFSLIKNQDGAKQNYHFTAEHIEKAIKKWKVNVNWIFGVETNLFRKNSVT